MRLIDADKAISDYAHYGISHSYDAYDLEDILTECPTIEAIPKTEYVSQLRTDMVAVLEELQMEIEDIVKEEELIDKKWANGLHYSEKIIQQQINALRGERRDGNVD